MTRLVYIAGASRSGSTLLARLLAQFSRAIHLGELTFFWERSLRDHEMCGCGRPLTECPLWSSVLREVASRGFDWTTSLPRLIEARNAIDYLPRMALGRQPEPGLMEAYGDSFSTLLSSVRDVSGREVLIDSSKRPSHGDFLRQLPDISLEVVHLVRDPRAVAYSAVRAKARPDAGRPGQFMPTNKPWRTAARWQVHNHLTEVLGRRSHSYHLVRYEDLMNDPAGTLQGLLRRLDLLAEPELAGIAAGDAVRFGPDHSVSGNPMRFDDGPVRLLLDNDWQRRLPARLAAQVTAITVPRLLRYGYPWRTAP